MPADAAGILFDHSTREGLEIFKSATRTLHPNEDDLFDVESPGLQGFLGLLQLRAITCSWAFTVPDDIADPNSPTKHLLQRHGEITLAHTRAHCLTWINGQSRLAQENIQMAQAVLNSLSMPGFSKVLVWKNDWMIDGLPAALCLIKVIICEAFIDTNATTRILREKLAALPQQLVLHNNDITALNSFVMVTLEQLNACGETSTDLLPNLFKAHLSAGDRTFTAHIEKKREDCDEGVAMTHNQLMEKAANKCKTLVEDGSWMAPSPEEQKIVALEAKLQKLQRPERKPPVPVKGTAFNKSPGSKPPPGKSFGKFAAKSKPKKDKPIIEEWMTKHPGEDFVNRGQAKKVNGKDHWWCEVHKRFVRHRTAECRLKTQAPNTAANSPHFNISSALLMEE